MKLGFLAAPLTEIHELAEAISTSIFIDSNENLEIVYSDESSVHLLTPPVEDELSDGLHILIPARRFRPVLYCGVIHSFVARWKSPTLSTCSHHSHQR